MLKSPVPPEEKQPEELPVDTKSITPWYKRQYNLDNVPQVSDLGGARPPVLNLKDHPELDGQKIAILDYRVKEGSFRDETGKIRDYLFIAALLVNGDNKIPVMLMTGAEDIYNRVMQLADVIQSGQPVMGTLSKRGRAWFID